MIETFDQPAPEPAGGLLGKVLGIVAGGFLFTATGSYLLASISIPMAFTLGIVGLGIAFSIHTLQEYPPVQLALLYSFTFFEGGFLGPIGNHFLKPTTAHDLAAAGAATALGMAAIGCVAFLFSLDYCKLSGCGSAALLALIAALLVNGLLRFTHLPLMGYLVLALASLITLIDFARIRTGGYGTTAVEMALAIYLDAIAILMAALILILSGRKRASWD